MTDLFDEVSQDLKDEKYSLLIRKLIRFFTIFSLMLVVGVSLYVWKENSANKLQLQLGSWFSKAMEASEKNKLEEALTYLDKIIEHSHQQYAALAYLNKASILAKQNKFSEAEKNLLSIVEYKHFNPAIRELAQLTYLSYQLKHPSSEKSSPDELLAKLTKEHKIWRLASLQLKALYDIKNKKPDEAKTSLNEILASKQATRSSYDTASSILASISRAE